MTIIFKIPNPKFFTVCKRFSSIDIFLLETGCLVAVMGYRAGVSEGKGGGSRHKTDARETIELQINRSFSLFL
jgi:hypothetical protein